MHIQTHILSGWCVANVLPLSPRERGLAMIAASAADLDGLGIAGGQEMYWRFHHVFGHNLFFALVISAALTIVPQHRTRAFVLYLALAHLHLFLDFLGSGPGWTIPYLWPTHHWVWKNPHVWALYSWQNICFFAAFLVWTIIITIRRGRTPLEAIMPNLDRQLVALLRRQCAGANSRSSATANC
jgi:hypothetical protein